MPKLFQEFPLGRKLYVGNLTDDVTQFRSRSLVRPFRGRPSSPRSSWIARQGRSKGFGFVEMENESDAMAAIDGLKEHEYGGRRLTVNEAKPRATAAPAYSNGGLSNGKRRYSKRRCLADAGGSRSSLASGLLGCLMPQPIDRPAPRPENGTRGRKA